MNHLEIVFDHFYVVVSREAYELAKQDPTLKEIFASTNEEHVKTGEGEEWTGFYLATLDNRYIELFYEGPRGYPQGAAGIGICSEKIDMTSELESHYRIHSPNDSVQIVTRTIDSKRFNRKLDWFTYFMPKMLENPFLKTWNMDYKAEFVNLRFKKRDENRFFRTHYLDFVPTIRPNHATAESILGIEVAVRGSVNFIV